MSSSLPVSTYETFAARNFSAASQACERIRKRGWKNGCWRGTEVPLRQLTNVTMKKPTIATVAEHAGVAVSTVSRYLNGHYVSAPVQAKLSEVIAALGYSRSWTARNLSLGRRGCIGVAVDSSSDPGSCSCSWASRRSCRRATPA